MVKHREFGTPSSGRVLFALCNKILMLYADGFHFQDLFSTHDIQMGQLEFPRSTRRLARSERSRSWEGTLGGIFSIDHSPVEQ